jgi:hypothetical protein
MNDRLFLLAAPSEDAKRAAGPVWFCPHCALLEGALLANPHWRDSVDIRHVAFRGRGRTSTRRSARRSKRCHC